MIYRSGIVDCYESYDYVKSMLDKIGRVTEFKIYRYDFEPYFEIEDGVKRYYHLIMFNDKGDEFWIDSNCGYPGTGPTCTKEILELLGIRDDYGISKNNIINKKNPLLNNDLNLLFVKPDYKGEKLNVLLKADFKFETAALRLKMIELVEFIGEMDYFLKDDERFNKYLSANRYDEISYGEYRINNIIFLNRRLQNISIDNLKFMLKYAIRKLGEKSIEVKFDEI